MKVCEATELENATSLALDSSFPIIFKAEKLLQDIVSQHPDGVKLQGVLASWEKKYSKKNPKYEASGRTFHTLSKPQGLGAATELIQRSIAAAKFELNGDLGATALYGYHPVLQHVGCEPTVCASLRYHVAGDIELVAMSAIAVQRCELDPCSFAADAAKFDSDSLAKLGDGETIWTMSLRPFHIVYIPAGWIVWSRVLKGSGEHNSVFGIRAGFFTTGSEVQGANMDAVVSLAAKGEDKPGALCQIKAAKDAQQKTTAA